jgi:hypothetical protein
VRARSFGFWNDASPQRPTISSERIVAGTSGTAGGSGAAEGADEEENEGRLKLPQAPKDIASAAAIPSLPAARALGDLIMAFPRTIRGRTPPQPSAKLSSEQRRPLSYAGTPIPPPKPCYIVLTNGLTFPFA